MIIPQPEKIEVKKGSFFLNKKTEISVNDKTKKIGEYIADELRVEGRVIEQRNEREVTVEGKIYKGDNLLCAQSHGTFAVFTAKAVKRMKIMPPEALDGFSDLLDLE